MDDVMAFSGPSAHEKDDAVGVGGYDGFEEIYPNAMCLCV